MPESSPNILSFGRAGWSQTPVGLPCPHLDWRMCGPTFPKGKGSDPRRLAWLPLDVVPCGLPVIAICSMERLSNECGVRHIVHL